MLNIRKMIRSADKPQKPFPPLFLYINLSYYVDFGPMAFFPYLGDHSFHKIIPFRRICIFFKNCIIILVMSETIYEQIPGIFNNFLLVVLFHGDSQQPVIPLFCKPGLSIRVSFNTIPCKSFSFIEISGLYSFFQRLTPELRVIKVLFNEFFGFGLARHFLNQLIFKFSHLFALIFIMRMSMEERYDGFCLLFGFNQFYGNLKQVCLPVPA